MACGLASKMATTKLNIKLSQIYKWIPLSSFFMPSWMSCSPTAAGEELYHELIFTWQLSKKVSKTTTKCLFRVRSPFISQTWMRSIWLRVSDLKWNWIGTFRFMFPTQHSRIMQIVGGSAWSRRKLVCDANVALINFQGDIWKCSE